MYLALLPVRWKPNCALCVHVMTRAARRRTKVKGIAPSSLTLTLWLESSIRMKETYRQSGQLETLMRRLVLEISLQKERLVPINPPPSFARKSSSNPGTLRLTYPVLVYFTAQAFAPKANSETLLD